MLQTNINVTKAKKDVNVTKAKDVFVVETIPASEIDVGVRKIMNTLNASTLRRFDEIFLNRALGKKVFVSQNVEVDKFAYIMSTFHTGLNNHNTGTIAQLGKIFLSTENKFLKLLSGLALRRLNWEVKLPIDDSEARKITRGLVELASEIGNDLVKTYC